MADERQDNWRFCRKCFSLFYYGYPGNGVCPAGEEHDASGSGNYYLVINREEQV